MNPGISIYLVTVYSVCVCMCVCVGVHACECVCVHVCMQLELSFGLQGGKEQLQDVREKEDEMEREDFEPKRFFLMHGKWLKHS